MNALPNTLARFAPPLWLMSALAALLGAALLVAFVDTLRENIRRGEEMRQWQRVGIVRHTTATLANAAPRGPATQLGNSLSQISQVSPNLQR